jgi:hypothetical protein
MPGIVSADGANPSHPASGSGYVRDVPSDWRAEHVRLVSQAPPDAPAVRWTAEIEWYSTPGGAGFRAAGGTEAGPTMSFGSSQNFEWPLRHPQAVEDVIDALEELESALLAAGWVALAPGASWYARRFSYGPVSHAPPSARRRRRGAARRSGLRLVPEPDRAS